MFIVGVVVGKAGVTSNCVVKVCILGSKPILVRILLDSGSQVTFTFDTLIRKLKIEQKKFTNSLSVTGMSDSKVKTSYYCTFSIRSRFNNFAIDVEADVIPSISYRVPLKFLSSLKLKYLSRNFANDTLKHEQVDIIIAYNAEMCFEDDSVVKNQLRLRNSKFGYVVSDVAEPKVRSSLLIDNRPCHLSTVDIESSLQKFWELEEFSVVEDFATEQERCLTYFINAVSRDLNGCFVVRLPLQHKVSELADIRRVVLKALERVEK